MTRSEKGQPAGSGKLEWRTPRLQELGNLRNFVQSGHAFGKSGGPADGSSDPGGEAMTKN